MKSDWIRSTAQAFFRFIEQTTEADPAHELDFFAGSTCCFASA